MTKYHALEEALSHADDATELYLDCSQLSENFGAIAELKNLEELHLNHVHAGLKIPAQIKNLSGLKKLLVAGPKDCLADFPTALFDVKFDELELVNFRVREIFPIADRLEHLRLRSHYIFDDFVPLCRTIRELQTLEISGFRSRNQNGNKKDLIIAPEIAELSKLRELKFSQCSLQSLPAELTLLKQLRRLDLTGAFNSNADLLAEHEDLEPLPSILVELPRLEALVIDDCGVPSFEPLAGLSSLTSLSAKNALAEDLEPLRGMRNLRRLDISAGYVRDLSPLEELENLETLIITNASVDNRSPLGALEKLVGLPELEEVIGNHVSPEAWQRLRSTEPVDITKLKWALASDDFEDVLQALDVIIDFSIERSTGEHNALFYLFDQEPEWGTINQYAPLDEAVERWAPKLDSSVLIRLIRATFISATDGWDATDRAIRELIRRGDTPAQVEVVSVYLNALEHYEPGHRFFKDSIHDRFCDEYFAEFGVDALLVLLVEAPEAMPDCEHGDQLGTLFVPAFHKLERPKNTSEINGVDADYDYGYLLNAVLEEFALNVMKGYGMNLEVVLDWIDEGARGTYRELALELRHLGTALKAKAERDAAAVEDRASTAEVVKTSEEAGDEESGDAIGPVDYYSLKAAFDTDGVDALVGELESVQERGLGKNGADYCAAYVHNKLLESLHQKQNEQATRLINAYRNQLEHIGMPTGAHRSRLAGNLIVLVLKTGDDELEDFLFNTLMPDKIADTLLAFNLACYYARQDERQKMLETIRHAIQLGKRRQDFLSDADFSEFVDDADFLGALKGD